MEVFTKKSMETDPKFGCKPEERSVKELIGFGVINLDKPAGPTSHQVSDYVQKILKIEKAGHSGSLDPKVTGVLPVVTERATRLSHVMLKGGKEYVGVMHLHAGVPEDILRETISSFVGKITQMPPVKSAVKRQLRERSVYVFEILEIIDQDVLFRVRCEAGTYIRKICHDIGKSLGVGAHMANLRRISVTDFDEIDSITLQDLQDAFVLFLEGNEKYIKHCILPAERVVQHLPKVWVADSAVESICHGRDVAAPGVSKYNQLIEGELAAVMTLKGELIALGFANTNEVGQKGIVVKTHKVFMKGGTYC
jgi:H/ACA ribonucleoprotein complex subunit 4